MSERLGQIRRAAPALLLAGTLSTGAVACAVSTQQEIQIGQQYAAEINRQLPIVNDQTVNQYINALGQEIARQGNRNLRYQVYIVNTDVVNAFAVPGGFVYLNRGLIENTDNLSELAGVLAHEIAHVELRHGAEMMERAQRTNLGLNVAYVLLGRAPSTVERAAINVGGSAVFARYGREAEHEADQMAVPLLVNAGIHPNGLVTFFNELIEERRRRPSAVEQWFSTHPLTEERIGEVREQIREVPDNVLRGLTTSTRAYESFKSRLSRYRAPPPEFRAR